MRDRKYPVPARHAGLTLALALLFASSAWSQQRAKNVILFIGDAGGIPTLSAASIHKYAQPQRLFIQQMPHLALMETSSASRWVPDSAAAMTAIMTGRKTQNGVIAQSEAAVRAKEDGPPLKTMLEYAEEHGLSTGVITDGAITGATPAACYAHVNDRKKYADIFVQLIKPRFGDGVDVAISGGRKEIATAAEKNQLVLADALKEARLPLFDSLETIPASARRAAVFFDAEFDLNAATQRAIDILSRNPKGFFLVVERDLHTEKIEQGLNHAIDLDNTIRATDKRMPSSDTLILFSADHSYNLRMVEGGDNKGQPLIPAGTAPTVGNNKDSLRLGCIRVEAGHAGEEVLVAARGPGAARVRGFLSNTDLFGIMMSAYGWKPSRPGAN